MFSADFHYVIFSPIDRRQPKHMDMRQSRAQRLTFFPLPLPNETIFSMVNRFHLRSGLPNLDSTFRLLFGKRKYKISSELLTAIPQLCLASHIPVKELILQNSCANYYRPFFQKKTHMEFEESLTHGDGELAISIIALIANRTVSEATRKYCAVCATDDIDKFGISYWHCEHQLPGIGCCLKHGEILNEAPKSKYRLFSPPKDGVSKNAIKSSAIYRYSSLALNCYQYKGGIFDTKRLFKSYFNGLARKGMVTDGGSLRLRVLNKALFEYWHDIFELNSFSRFNPLDNRSGFPESLFYKPNANHHPIKHLLLIGYIFGDWDTFLWQYNSDVSATPRKKISNSPDLEHKKQIATQLLHKGMTYAEAAKQSGLSISTLCVLAEKQGIQKSCRPRALNDVTKRAIWRKLTIGMPIQSIAKEHGVPESTVQNFLSAHPYLSELRKRIRMHGSKHQHRSTIQSLLTENPNLTRSAIRRIATASYVWLHRHDKEWFLTILPPSIPRNQRNKLTKQ